jgi:3',5'-cyclic-AMP phosphodiesterase
MSILIEEATGPIQAPVVTPHDELIAAGVAGQTLSLVGDIHFGGNLAARMDTAQRALQAMNGSYALRVYLGDLTENGGNATEWPNAAAWIAANANPGNAPYKAIAGNHDYIGGDTAATFASFIGYDPSWTVDIGTDLRVVGFSPDTLLDPPATFSAGKLAWLEAAVTTTRSVIICSHVPLKDSVNESGKTTPFYQSHPHASLIAILAAHPNVRAWISGHTHSTLAATNLIMSYSVGPHRIAAINASAVSSTPTKPGTIDQGNHSLYLTVFPDRLEARFHNHKSGRWASVKDATVTTLSV